MDDKFCLDLLRACELFKDLNEPELNALFRSMVQVKILPGEVLITQGEISDCMYVLLSGRLLVKQTDGKTIAQIGRGQTVGEMGVITNEPRSATVVAMRESILLKLEQNRFTELWKSHPSLLFEITKIVAKRLRKTIRPPQKYSNNSNILVVKGNQQADMKLFLDQLSASFDHRFRYKILRRADFPLSLSEEEFDRQIQDVETHYDFLFYEIGSILDEWSDLCLGYADRILVLADASQEVNYDPRILSLLNSNALHQEIKRVLILLYDPSRKPKNTIAWLQPVHFFRHYHVRFDQKEDFARLLRFMNGTAIGLVFGGGGTRGWAQVGAMKYISEQNIPLDAFAGTSAGALNAASLALARDYNDYVEMSKRFAKAIHFKDYTLPLASILSSESLTSILMELFGDIKIEDLERPFFCITGDLFTNKEVEIHEGLLWRALRASMSLPGVYPPVYIESDGQLLVDGGVVNNVPVDAMRNYLEGFGKIISMAVSDLSSEAIKYDYPLVLTWKKILWNKFFSRPKTLKVPYIVDTFVHGLALASNQKSIASGALSDIHIKPKLVGFKILDASRINELREIGYESAKKALANWRNDLDFNPE